MSEFHVIFAVLFMLVTLYVFFKFNTTKEKKKYTTSTHRFIMSVYYMFGAYYFLKVPPTNQFFDLIGWWDVGLSVVYLVIAIDALRIEVAS